MAWKNVQYENGKMRTSEGGGGGGSSTFADLEDVSFSNLQNGQVPKYNSTTGKWENANESGGGGTVTDVKVDGQSVVDPQTGEANITMPTPPTIPVTDVKVNGTSVVDGNKEAQIKSYKEVTQSEYNALPDSKLNDGILYAIKDVGGSDGFPPLIYNDEEREIGVWRDGKPLYQKTIYVNTSIPSSTSYVVADITNQVLVDVHGIMLTGASAGFNIPYYDNSNRLAQLWWGNNELKVYQVGYNASGLIVIIKYTKTTDTPGSGTWTTQGALAHHYSTDEHIIGTWIDGKPLYEKTISRNQRFSLVADSWAATDIAYSEINAKHIPYGTIEALNDSGYPVLHMGFCLAIINGYININSFRTVSYNNGYTLTLQYTKATDY